MRMQVLRSRIVMPGRSDLGSDGEYRKADSRRGRGASAMDPGTETDLAGTCWVEKGRNWTFGESESHVTRCWGADACETAAGLPMHVGTGGGWGAWA
eukprot:872895-Rhodomonas_salina.2